MENITKSELFAQLASEKKHQSLIPREYKFENPGDTITGVLINWVLTDSGKDDKTYMRYVLETDNGLESFSAGHIVDQTLPFETNRGGLVMITYKGKKETKSGNRLNDFEVDIIPADVWRRANAPDNT